MGKLPAETIYSCREPSTQNLRGLSIQILPDFRLLLNGNQIEFQQSKLECAKSLERGKIRSRANKNSEIQA